MKSKKIISKTGLEYTRYVDETTGQLVASDPTERFLAKVVKDPSGCWLWQGVKDKAGYGLCYFKTVGKTYSAMKAHRASYYLFKSQDLPKVVMHACDNPSCVNPEHLQAGTHAENERDKDRKNRRRFQRRKLDYEMAQEIRRLRTEGLSWRDLGARFGIGRSQLHNVLTGAVWTKPLNFKE